MQLLDCNLLTQLLSISLSLSLSLFFFSQAVGNQDVDIGSLKQVLKDWLPAAHYDTLQFLIHHLNRWVIQRRHQYLFGDTGFTKHVHWTSLFYPLCSIQLLQEDNKMTASNLAVVFAPTMMRSADNDLAFMKDLPQQTKLVEALILNSDTIFSDWCHFFTSPSLNNNSTLIFVSFPVLTCTHFHVLAPFVFV